MFSLASINVLFFKRYTFCLLLHIVNFSLQRASIEMISNLRDSPFNIHPFKMSQKSFLCQITKKQTNSPNWINNVEIHLPFIFSSRSFSLAASKKIINQRKFCSFEFSLLFFSSEIHLVLFVIFVKLLFV